MQREGVTFFAGVPDDVLGAARRARPDAASTCDAIAGNLRMAVSGGAALPVEMIKQFEERFGVDDPRGVRPVRDQPGRHVQPARTGRAKPGSIGQPVWGVEVRLVDDDWNDRRGRDGRGRRDRDPRPQRHEGLLRPARGHRRGDRRDGWFRTGDIGPPRRGRLLLHRRPREGHDHPRRLQRVPAGDRGGPASPTRRSASPRSSACRTSARRGGQGVRHPQARAPRSPRTSSSRWCKERMAATSTRASSSSATACR